MTFGAQIFNRNGRLLFDSRSPSLVAVARHVIPYGEKPFPRSGTHALHLDGSGSTYLNALYNYWISHPRHHRYNGSPSLPDNVLYFVKIPAGGYIASLLQDSYNIQSHMLKAQNQTVIELVVCRPMQPDDYPKNSHGAIFYDRDGNVTWHSEAPVVSLVDVITGRGAETVSPDAPWIMLPRMFWVDESDPKGARHFWQKDFPIGVHRISSTKIRLSALVQSKSKHSSSAIWSPTPPVSLTARINTSLIPTIRWPNQAPY